MKPLVEERALTITTPLLAAYLKCPTKCWHRLGGEQVTGGTYLRTKSCNVCFTATTFPGYLSNGYRSRTLRLPLIADE